MAAPPRGVLGNPAYPTSDGRPVAETDWHRELLAALIDTLTAYYAAEPLVYVSGNLLVYYEPGNRRRRVAPDVFVVKGVPRGDRLNYLTWEEGKGPDVVIELTSRSTRAEDTKRKFCLYRDVLKVPEYFLFDVLRHYLDPPLQGYRLRQGQYIPIRAVNGRLPSKVLGLHLEPSGEQLRLVNPVGAWLPTPQEQAARAEARAAQAETRAAQAEAESERLQREVEALRRRLGERRYHGRPRDFSVQRPMT